jgi:hypothetical protein
MYNKSEVVQRALKMTVIPVPMHRDYRGSALFFNS